MKTYSFACFLILLFLVTTSNGFAQIGKGTVIAYGHLISAPHNIEINSDTLFVDDYPFLPSRISRSRPKIEITPEIELLSDFTKELFDVYDSVQAIKSREEAMNEVRKRVAEESRLESYKWLNEYSVLLVAGPKAQVAIGFSDWSFDEGEEPTPSHEAILEKQADLVRATLQEEGIVIFGQGVQAFFGSLDAQRMLSEFDRILQGSELPDTKLQLLRKVLPEPQLTKEILEYYPNGR